MHELSICKNILSTVLDYHQQHKKSRTIKSIQIAIGQLTHIDIASLRFNFAVIARNTAAENAMLDINQIDAKAECNACNRVFSLENYYDPCPNCQQHSKTILQGEEMTITSMEIQ
jgi:hydrogenase nickel incorporation protein HypA/HybF